MKNPTYAYRRAEDGSVEAKIFDGHIPEGWFDSPARVDEAAEPADPPADEFTPEGIAKMPRKDVVQLLGAQGVEADPKAKLDALRDQLSAIMFVQV